MTKKIFLLISIIIILGGLANFALAQQKIEIYLFWSKGCPHCLKEKPFLENLAKQYSQIELKKYEVSENPDNIKFFDEMLKKYNVPLNQRGYVPMLFISQSYWKLGYDSDETTGKEIGDYIKSLIGNETKPPAASSKNFSFFGKKINISPTTSLLGLTLLFGLTDGINPCMFSVLLMLLAYLLAISSSKRTIKSGIIFGFCVFLIYFSLMLGIYKGLCFFQTNFVFWIGKIKFVLGLILLLFGVWQLKDFFFLKEDQKLSFAIPGFAKPAIQKFISYATIPSVILLALFSSLVELPCTFALPLGYTTILSENVVSPYFYLILYNFFFVLPLFVIVALVAFGFSRVEKIENWRKRTRKLMRLVSGILLLGLGIVFLLKMF